MYELTWGWHNRPQWSRCKEASARCSWMESLWSGLVTATLILTWQHLAKQMAFPHCGAVSPTAQVPIFWPGVLAPAAGYLHDDHSIHLVLKAPCSGKNCRPLLRLFQLVPTNPLLILRHCLDERTLHRSPHNILSFPFSTYQCLRWLVGFSLRVEWVKVEEKEVGLDQVGHWDRGVSVSNFAASPALTDSRPNNIEGLDFPIWYQRVFLSINLCYGTETLLKVFNLIFNFLSLISDSSFKN